MKLSRLSILAALLLCACSVPGIKPISDPPGYTLGRYATNPTAPPAPTAAQRAAQAFFPLGVFEDGNITGGDTAAFEAMITDLRAHGLDTVLFTNNTAARDEALLAVADRMHFNVLMLPAGDLFRTWWIDETPATIEAARAAAQPIVERWKDHASLKGYVVVDEPMREQTYKLTLMMQAIRELDPDRPVLMTLIGKNRVGPIFETTRPDVLQIDVYPLGRQNAPCDLSMTGFGYPNDDFVSYIRAVTANRPATTPLWIILQTHSFDAGGASLRTPLTSELRMQQWLALGEGAQGLFWFVYSTQQSWIGLKDNAPLYDEVAALAERITPLKSTLLTLHKAADTFIVQGAHRPYISTLETADQTRTYVIVVNRDCQHEQALTVRSRRSESILRDLETGAVYALDQPIPFRPGDGKIFEVQP